MWSQSNPYLNGLYEPLNNEYVIEELRVIGDIPRELNGALYRMTTNQQHQPFNADRFHWFDGDGMVHAFYLRDGKASYRNRWILEDGLRAERAAGRTLYNGLMSGSGIAKDELPPGAPQIKVPPNINIVTLGGRLLALNEDAPHYWEIAPNTLETVQRFDFDQAFAEFGDDGMLTAHPHLDTVSGEMLFYAINPQSCILECFTVGIDGAVNSRHKVQLDAPAWIHDFSFTEHYWVFFFGSLNCRASSVEVARKEFGMIYNDPDLRSRILLIERETGNPTWIPETDLYMVTHFLNAYQENGRVIVDAGISQMAPSSSDLRVGDFFPFPLPDKGTSPFSGPELHRWVINPQTAKAEHTRLGEFNGEFFRINEAVGGTKHQFGYMAAVHRPKGEVTGFNCLVKHDFTTGQFHYQFLSQIQDHCPGEPIFVAKPGATAEDEGWILAVWGDPEKNTSELVILDAQDFAGEPLARVMLDHRVTAGFHGNWISDEQLAIGKAAALGR